MTFKIGDIFKPGKTSNAHYRITAEKNRATLKVLDIGSLGLKVMIVNGLEDVGSVHWVSPNVFEDAKYLSQEEKTVPAEARGTVTPLRIVSIRRKVVYL